MPRPKGEYRQLLEQAMKAEQNVQKVSLLRHAIKMAYSDNAVLIAIVRKLLPDLKSVDMKTVGDSPFRLIIDLTGKTTGKRTKGIKDKQDTVDT